MPLRPQLSRFSGRRDSGKRIPLGEFAFMGYSMRTGDGWRYTAWVRMNPNTSRVDWARYVHHELYE